MNRNVTIVVILLIFAVIAAYLVWLRGQYTQQMAVQAPPVVNQPVQQPSPEPTMESTTSAVPSASVKPATSSARPATGSATRN